MHGICEYIHQYAKNFIIKYVHICDNIAIHKKYKICKIDFMC